MEKTARHIVFSGRVQGVGFRFTVHRVANRFELTGFVRNLPDGRVEMLAQGLEDDINDCIRDIEESFVGYVRDKQVVQLPVDDSYSGFAITF